MLLEPEPIEEPDTLDDEGDCIEDEPLVLLRVPPVVEEPVRDEPLCEPPVDDPEPMLPEELEPPVVEPDVPVEEPEPPDVPDCAATTSGREAARAVKKRVRMDEFISDRVEVTRRERPFSLGARYTGCASRCNIAPPKDVSHGGGNPSASQARAERNSAVPRARKSRETRADAAPGDQPA